MSPISFIWEEAASLGKRAQEITKPTQNITKPTNPNGLILESWAQGFMVGALIIMSCITLANMRRGVLLHKLILIEVKHKTGSTVAERPLEAILAADLNHSSSSASGMVSSSSLKVRFTTGGSPSRPSSSMCLGPCTTSSHGSRTSLFSLAESR